MARNYLNKRRKESILKSLNVSPQSIKTEIILAEMLLDNLIKSREKLDTQIRSQTELVEALKLKEKGYEPAKFEPTPNPKEITIDRE